MGSPSEGVDPNAAILRAARILGRAFGFVPAFLAAASPAAPERAPLLSESDIRAVAHELGLPAAVPLRDLKVAIADAIPHAPDEAVLRAVGKISGVYPRSRGDAIIGVLRRLGAP